MVHEHDARPLILVDLDDTLALTNAAVCKWHNEVYKTDLDLEDFHSFFYWKVWGGTQAETQEKVAKFNASSMAENLEPVPGAKVALESLKRRGYRLEIITARSPSAEGRTARFLERHFPNLISNVIFTNAFQGVKDEHQDHHGSKPSMSGPPPLTQNKSSIVLQMKAVALIDDSIETALECALNWYGNGLETPSPGRLSAPSDGAKKLSSWPEEDRPSGSTGTVLEEKKLPQYILFGKWPWNNRPTDRPDPKVPDPPTHPADLDEDFIDPNAPGFLQETQEAEDQLVQSLTALTTGPGGSEKTIKAKEIKDTILRGEIQEEDHADNGDTQEGSTRRARRPSAAELAQALGSGIKAGQISRIAMTHREKRARKRSLWEGDRLPKGVTRVKSWKDIMEGPWFPDLRKT